MGRHKNKPSSEGFTIVELLIATLVFSVVLLVATLALIRVSEIYIKGVIGTETADTSRNIVNNLTQNIQNSAGLITLPQNPSGNTWYFCINGNNYTYKLGTVYTTSTPSTGFWEQSATTCGPVTSGRELLSPNERIVSFSIVSLGSKLYQISFKLLHGTDSATIGGSGNACVDYNGGGEFCSVFQTTTTVQQRT
jgi:prepilin-type N-terminal cleavage/methylation domain-containing protein